MKKTLVRVTLGSFWQVPAVDSGGGGFPLHQFEMLEVEAHKYQPWLLLLPMFIDWVVS